MPTTFLSFSGGLDSTTLLCMLRNRGCDVRPVFFHYGSKHNAYERAAAEAVLAEVCPDVPLAMVDLSQTGIFSANGSALLASSPREVPDGGYSTPGSLAATVVPGRNMIMASILASIAEVAARHTIGEPVEVALAVHAGDHALYPDCRPAFIDHLAKAIFASSEGNVGLSAPFLRLRKADIVRIGLDNFAPFHLTRSCYKQQAVSCGRCGTCMERLEAFHLNGVEDPIPYAPNAEA